MFVTAGGFEGSLQDEALTLQQHSPPQPDPKLRCNAEEADTRIWLHALHSAGEKKLVVSPDTDVYHIGLPIVAKHKMDVKVQLSRFNSKELCLLDIGALLDTFSADPELASIPNDKLATTMQMVYLSTGCDYVSFFHGFGKASFIQTFWRYAEFITSGLGHTPGTLTDTSLVDGASDLGFLAFMRLVGSVYFHKHRSAFLPAFTSPNQHFNSFCKEGQHHHDQHLLWLQDIRNRIWGKIQYEEDMLPSDEALKRHWKRASWVADMWQQATQNVMVMKAMRGNGWIVEDRELRIDWDSRENMMDVRQRVSLLRKGCSCRRSACTTMQCGCKRERHSCGAGCTCLNCCNLPASSREADTKALTVEGDEDIEHIMGWVL